MANPELWMNLDCKTDLTCRSCAEDGNIMNLYRTNTGVLICPGCDYPPKK